ncbi:MAG: cation:H+ antiporter [Patescibacteria group bacterium]|nr:cation:H+ antiporter [Patescibacteria group bacterium]
MSDAVFQIVLYVASFIGVWWGAGLVVNTISRVAYAIKLPEFTISFFILGILTSLPEMSVAVTSLVSQRPAISVGNLIGAVLVLFLLVIPLLGLSNSGVKIPKPAQRLTLMAILLVCFLPTFLLRDRMLQTWEGWVCIGAYIVLFFIFSKDQSILERFKRNLRNNKHLNWWDGVKIMSGVGLLFLGSTQIVESTIYFGTVLNIAPFFVSLVIVSLGTNIPEITLVFRSILLKKPDVAMADYLGSASANTLTIGLLSVVNQNTIEIPNHFAHRFLFMLIGLCLVFLFMRSRNRLSRLECFLLLVLYVLFISVELLLI